MKDSIQLFKVHMAPTAAEEVSKVLNSGYIGQGSKVDEFENQLKDYFNHDFIQTLNSGTSVLHMALHLLKKPSNKWPGIKEGDEVLGTALTCTASNFPILANGLKIKWVDIDAATLKIDLDDLARKSTPKTKAIILVHWGGYPSDLNKIKQIQNKAEELYGFKPAVIEDGAHSFGSKYMGKYIGTHGNLTMYSLQAIKHITSIDGGLLLSPHQELHRRGKLIRWYGIDRDSNRKDFRCEADIPEWGFKFHMNDINAAIGLGNFKMIHEITGRHRDNAAYYDSSLTSLDGITLLERQEGFDSSFWIYSILVEKRDDFQRWMKERGVATSQVHERNDIHSCVREYKTILPNLDSTIKKISSIPVGWWVTDEEREWIVESIKMGW